MKRLPRILILPILAVGLCASAEPPIVGTIGIAPRIIVASDPSAFEDLT